MIANSIINVLNKIISVLGSSIAGIMSLLPDSPFNNITSNSFFGSISGYVNYFLPVNTILIIFTSWLTAISIYYLSMIILRWIKVIE